MENSKIAFEEYVNGTIYFYVVSFIILSILSSTCLPKHNLINTKIERIELEGVGALAVCTLSFFNGDEQSMDEYQKIIFTKTDHPTQSILIPHKIIHLSDFAYCSLKVFSGSILPDDKVLLYYTARKTVESSD